MNKLAGTILCILIVSYVSAADDHYEGKKTIFPDNFFACGARVAGRVPQNEDDVVPPRELTIIACELNNWKNQKEFTIQKGEAESEVTYTQLCNDNFYVDDTRVIFLEQFQYYEKNTMEIQDFVFHCNDGAQYTMFNHTTEFEDWDIWQYYYYVGFQVTIDRESDFWSQYKHVNLLNFYRYLKQEQITEYQSVLAEAEEETYTEAALSILEITTNETLGANGCPEGLVMNAGTCQKICEIPLVNDGGVCREKCENKAHVIYQGTCLAECPEGLLVEDGQCVGECGLGRESAQLTIEEFNKLFGIRRHHKASRKNLNKKIRKAHKKSTKSQ